MNRIVKRYTTDTFIEKAKKVHDNKYLYNLVEYKNSTTKIKIICKLHGVFEQAPSSHIYGQGCKICGNIKNSISRRSSLEEFIKKSKELHNNLYDYSLVEYVNNHTKVKLLCKHHGEFLVKPNHHIQSNVGCRLCANINRIQPRRKTLQSYIDDANKVHNNFYDYSLIKEYKSGKDILKIICKNHGEFSQKAENHTNSKQGCPKCGFIKLANSLKKLPEDFITECKSIHRNTYDYSETLYSKAHNKIDLICRIHGKFSIVANVHLCGFGCPKCSKKISKPSNDWLSSLNIPEIIPEYQIPEYKKMRVDGYDVKTNTVYQFHGTFWHGDLRIYDKDDIQPVIKKTYGELYEKTKINEEKIKNWGYNLVVMWEYDWQLLNKSLKK